MKLTGTHLTMALKSMLSTACASVLMCVLISTVSNAQIKCVDAPGMSGEIVRGPESFNTSGRASLTYTWYVGGQIAPPTITVPSNATIDSVTVTIGPSYTYDVTLSTACLQRGPSGPLFYFLAPPGGQPEDLKLLRGSAVTGSWIMRFVAINYYPNSVLQWTVNIDWSTPPAPAKNGGSGSTTIPPSPPPVPDLTKWAKFGERFADVNGDGRADYCRFVGNSPNIALSCNLATVNGFDSNQYTFNSINGIDPGYSSLPRTLADVSGDGRADYCRFVGNSPNIALSCNLARATGFDSNQYTFNSISGIDPGYSSLPRTLADVNGDGRTDYCRFVGNSPNIALSCNLATVNGFDSNQYGFSSIKGIDHGYK